MMSDNGDPAPNAASSTSGKLTRSALVSQELMTMVPGRGNDGAGRLKRLYSSIWAPPQGRRSKLSASASSNPYSRKKLRLAGEASTKVGRWCASASERPHLISSKAASWLRGPGDVRRETRSEE